MQSNNPMDIWDILKIIASDWKVVTILGTIISVIVGVIIRFRNVEDKVNKSTTSPSDDVNPLLRYKSSKLSPSKYRSEQQLHIDLVDYLDRKFEVLNDRMDKIESDTSELRDRIINIENILNNIEESKEDNITRNRLLMKGVAASLEGLLKLGSNGPVKNALADLDNYKELRASE